MQLVYTQYKVRFNTTPQNATVALYKNGASSAYGDPILPDEQGYYTIIFGQYRYTVSAEGYTPVSKTFNATDTALKNNNYVITVKLGRQAADPGGQRPVQRLRRRTGDDRVQRRAQRPGLWPLCRH